MHLNQKLYLFEIDFLLFFLNMKKTKLSVVHDDVLLKGTIIKKKTSNFRWNSNSHLKRNFLKIMSFVVMIVRKMIPKLKTNGQKKQFLSLNQMKVRKKIIMKFQSLLKDNNKKNLLLHHPLMNSCGLIIVKLEKRNFQ
jgi:hypothetical protein